jgi:predicted RNA-binding protein with PIN domain
MQLLLDGYNILKKVKKISHISDSERQKFIKQLNNYAHKKNLSLILVFDGGPFSWPQQEKISSFLIVIYSGANESADDYIKSYLDQHKNNDILLVSSDRELTTYARHYSIASLDSYEFLQFFNAMEKPLQATSNISGKALKLTTKSTQELDLLMEQINLNKVKKEPEPLPHKEKSQKLSKKERELMKIIKKL